MDMMGLTVWPWAWSSSLLSLSAVVESWKTLNEMVMACLGKLSHSSSHCLAYFWAAQPHLFVWIDVFWLNLAIKCCTHVMLGSCWVDSQPRPTEFRISIVLKLQGGAAANDWKWSCWQLIFHTSSPSLCALRRWQTRVPKRLQMSLNPRDPASLLVASTHPKHISGWDHNPQVSEISQTRFLHFSHFCHFILFHPWIYPLKCTVCLKPKQCAVFRQLPTLRFLDEFLTRSSHCNNQQSLLPLTFKHNSLRKIRAFPQWITIPNIDHQPTGGLKTANVKTCPRYVFAVKSAGLLGERLGEPGELSPSSAWCFLSHSLRIRRPLDVSGVQVFSVTGTAPALLDYPENWRALKDFCKFGPIFCGSKMGVPRTHNFDNFGHLQLQYPILPIHGSEWFWAATVESVESDWMAFFFFVALLFDLRSCDCTWAVGPLSNKAEYDVPHCLAGARWTLPWCEGIQGFENGPRRSKKYQQCFSVRKPQE